MKMDYFQIAWAFQKYSPYLQLFNYHLKKMEEKGSFRKHYKRFQPPPQICPDGAGKPIGFNSCLTAFLAFVGMYQISIILIALYHKSYLFYKNVS